MDGKGDINDISNSNCNIAKKKNKDDNNRINKL